MTDTAEAIAPVGSLRGRDFVSAGDLSPAEIRRVLATAARLKADFSANRRHERPPLVRRTLAMLFERPSLRTRVTFEAGMVQLGGSAIQLTAGNVGWGVRETVADVARNLQAYVDAIVIRTGPHEVALEFAARASIPVINALTLHEHPCQALADVYTIEEAMGSIAGRLVTFVGDGNNVFHSLAIVAAGQGAHVRLAHPPGYGPDPAVVQRARELGATAGGTVTLGADARAMVEGADVIYTDAWTSMGQESETEARRAAFASYQVDAGLVAIAGPAARVLHCLPAHRGEEITSDVMDGPQSLVFQQSENRLHVQKGLLVELLGDPAHVGDSDSADAGDPGPGADGHARIGPG
ncbi:MAG: ornithine carbamoyltransferase [Chloroflexi bacterium]|nr:ornithine carbamoyltransferase [Chloroflexota bacterium]